eukprot:6423784-Pyramimonas_sp.AAC.1
MTIDVLSRGSATGTQSHMSRSPASLWLRALEAVPCFARCLNEVTFRCPFSIAAAPPPVSVGPFSLRRAAVKVPAKPAFC